MEIIFSVQCKNSTRILSGCFSGEISGQMEKEMKFSKSDLICSGLLVALLVCVMTSDSFAVNLEAMRGPVVALKQNVFGSWMVPVKIMGVAAAGAISFFKQSLAPFGIGVGTVLGISFFDAYLEGTANGALI